MWQVIECLQTYTKPGDSLIELHKPGLGVHTYNPSAQQMEAAESEIQGHSLLRL